MTNKVRAKAHKRAKGSKRKIIKKEQGPRKEH